MAEQLVGRILDCGSMVEVVEYRTPITLAEHRTVTPKRVVSDYDFEDLTDLTKRVDNIERAKANLRRIIWANMSPYTKFLTLTYKKTVLDVNKVRRDLTTFFQSMRRRGYTMQYVYVLEHQLNRGKNEGNMGCLHAHIVLFDKQFIDCNDIKSCWKHGRTEIRKIKKIKNLGAYVAKYLSKENTIVELNGKMFVCSKGIKRPTVCRVYSFSGCVYADKEYIRGVHYSVVQKHMKITYEHISKRQYFNEATCQVCTQEIRHVQGRLVL